MAAQRWKEEFREYDSRLKPCLHFVPFSVPRLIDDIVSAHFDGLPHTVTLDFVKRGPLACVWHGDRTAMICIHHILNSRDTPREVIGFIVKHELIHLEIPPAEIDGRRVHHPPEFWERERAICPELIPSWNWIWRNFWDCLKTRPRLERIDVEPSWKQRWWQPRVGYADKEWYDQPDDRDAAGMRTCL